MSIVNRFIIAFSSNILKSAITFITSLAIAKCLAPDLYGDFAYLLFTFTTIKTVVDAGTSSAFMTFISEKSQSKKFFVAYILLLLGQFSVVCLFVLLINVEIVNSIWGELPREVVFFAFLSVFFQSVLWNAVSSLAESIRETKIVAIGSLIISIFHFIVIYLLIYGQSLSLSVIYIIVALEFLVLSLFAIKIILKKHVSFFSGSDDEESFSSIYLKFYRYSLPLLLYIILSSLYLFFERWLLYKFAGSSSMAYFSVGVQVSAVALIATTSILKIFWKEIAEANSNSDYLKVKGIYEKITTNLTLFSVVLIAFSLPWVELFADTFLGSEYSEGVLVFSVLLILPIYQSLGQLNSTMFYSLSFTKQYSKLAILLLLPNVVISYFILAPQEMVIPGYGLGPLALAIKYVLFQFCTVNILTYFLYKNMRWKYSLLKEIKVVIYLVLAICFSILIKFIIYEYISENDYIALTLSIIVYFTTVIYSLFLVGYIDKRYLEKLTDKLPNR